MLFKKITYQELWKRKTEQKQRNQYQQGRHSMKLAKAKELWNYGIKFQMLKFLRLANITKTQNLPLS